MSALSQKKSGDTSLFVGIGGHSYRIDRPWGDVPGDIPIGMFAAVACDSKDNVYVFQRFDPLADRGPHPAILKFDAQGRYLGAWGVGLIKDAHHMYIDKQDRVFLVDRDAHQIIVCDPDGKVLFTIGERDKPGHPFGHPTSVAVAPSGDIYVSDGYGATNVHRFAADGTHISTWGALGSGAGEFTTPHGIACLSDGTVLVGDRENDRVQAFDGTGRHLRDLRGFFHPMFVYVDATDTIFVSDQIPRLTAVKADGTLVGMCRPVLNGGHAVFGDGAGNLYLAESRPNRITRMTRND